MDELEKWLWDKTKIFPPKRLLFMKDEVVKLREIANLLASNRAEIETLKKTIAEMQK